MKLLGTIVNGRVELDTPTDLPDGTRVVSLEAEEFEDEGVYEYPHPMAPYDREKEIALPRERIAERDAGVPGLSVDEAFAAVDAMLDDWAVARKRT